LIHPLEEPAERAAHLPDEPGELPAAIEQRSRSPSKAASPVPERLGRL